MIILGLVLSLLMGGVLGLFGGGGSVLTVPILVYVLGMSAKPAVATSLLVVATSSALGAVQHARARNVWLRTALLFGGVAMLGSYGGARLAAFVPGHLLLVLFAGSMAVTGVMMLRARAAMPAGGVPAGLPKLAVEGLGVGMLTGLVGAGGGFLVVPALMSLGGLPMHAAIGTSLLVIALNAFTALLGYLAHATIDVGLAALVTTAAAVGALLGGRLASRLPATALRRGFGGLVLAMAAVMLWKEAPMPSMATAFLDPLLGGVLIGLAAAALLLLNGQIAGISGIVGGLLHPKPGDLGWRIAFVAGLLAGGTALASLRPEAFGPPLAQPTAVFVLAGLLVGAGTRLGSGCTSGHGVCGLGRGSVRSLVATATFMLSGAAVVFLTHHVLGGHP
jgi:uncharacterized membrane protein YfcA/uncharacterized membrane protein YedE/YeeE